MTNKKMIQSKTITDKQDSARCIGIMSGTSIDGIDVVVAEFSTTLDALDYTILAYRHFDFSTQHQNLTRQAIATQDLIQSQAVGQAISHLYADFALQTLASIKLEPADIDFLAVSGQTLHHQPPLQNKNGYTIDMTDLSLIAAKTQILTIGKFRQKDMSLGGHGAPLVPFAHAKLLGKHHQCLAIQNLGGVGNVSLLEKANAVLGFDTGPGNVWMDQTIAWHSKGQLEFDDQGNHASLGKVDQCLVTQLLAHPFFHQAPPKSIDIKTLGLPYLSQWKEPLLALSMQDALATVTFATASTIANAYQKWILSNHKPSHLIVCGGGALNKTLLTQIQNFLPDIKVQTSQEYQINPHAMEALCFALLGLYRFKGQNNVLSKITGALHDSVGGEIAHI